MRSCRTVRTAVRCKKGNSKQNSVAAAATVVASGHPKLSGAIAGLVYYCLLLFSAVYTVDEQEQALCCVSARPPHVESACIFIFPPIERKFQRNVTQVVPIRQQGQMLTETEKHCRSGGRGGLVEAIQNRHFQPGEFLYSEWEIRKTSLSMRLKTRLRHVGGFHVDAPGAD